MKKIGLFFLVIVTAFFICGCSGETISTEQGERVFGSFATTDLNGNVVTDQVFAGYHLTMVNIWGTFCTSCIEELSDLSKLQTQFGTDFQVIGIALDAADQNGNIIPEKKAEALSIVEKAEGDYLHLIPSLSMNRAYLSEIQSVPVTLFVDENGNQIGNLYFGSKSKTEWKKIVEALWESVE